MNTVNRAARRAGILFAAALLFAADASAQSAEGMRAYLVDGFERAKAWDLAIAEAMPDSAMSWAPTEGVRSYAAQIVHTANNGFISQPLFGKDAPAFGVEEGNVPSKAALISAVTEAYDFIISSLNEMDPASLGESVDFFGRSMPRGRVALFALEHATWTRGQLVPYMHAHGVAVPQARLF